MDPCPCGCGLARIVDTIPWEGEWSKESCDNRYEKDQRCRVQESFISQEFSGDTPIETQVNTFQGLIAALQEFKPDHFRMRSQATGSDWSFDFSYPNDNAITFIVTASPYIDVDDEGEPIERIEYPPVTFNLLTSQFEVYGYTSKVFPEQLRCIPFRPELSPFIKSANKQ